MTRVRTPKAVRVDPSARDPIASWLDVFVPLLGVSRARQQTIRDELEDHLRSRVDDLVIAGSTEQDAVRRAVAELGETAELARSFRDATGQTSTRRFIMTSAVFTAIGAGIVVGVATVFPSHGVGSAGNAGSAAEDHQRAVHAMPERVEVRDTTYAQLVETLRSAADRPVLVHWDRLEGIHVTPETALGLDVGPLPHRQVYELLRERGQREWGDMIAIAESDDLVELTTQHHIDERTTEVRSHEVGDLLTRRRSDRPMGFASADHLLDTVSVLCSMDDWDIHGGEHARARIAGGVLFLDAPERIDAEVEAVLATMRTDIERAMAEERASEERAAAELHRRYEQAKAELQALVAEHAVKRPRMNELSNKLVMAVPEVEEDERMGKRHELAMLELEVDLIKTRIELTKQAVLEMEFDPRLGLTAAAGAGSGIGGRSPGRGAGTGR